MRVTYQIGARFVSALKDAMEREAEEIGISVNVNVGELSELTFDGVQNPSQYIQEFAALYEIDDTLKVKAVGSGVYSVELGERNRIAAYAKDDDLPVCPSRRKRAGNRRQDSQVIHGNLFGSAGRDEVDKDLCAAFA
ncbi:MAG: hypothetical protein HY512_03960 [Candidatus Aenigmarchaeota archaeon]|nr:hypothetical protein [Candidatus Aenigmarchaeota archaeon]